MTSYVFTQAFDKHSLQRFLREMASSRQALTILLQIAEAHLRLEQVAEAPRVIRCSSVFFKSDVVKLTDLGLTKCDDEPTASSLTYLSPQGLAGQFSSKGAVWSAGIILYRLLFGSLPFKQQQSPEELRIAIGKRFKEGSLEMNEEQLLRQQKEPELMDLLKRMLAPTAEQRPDWAQVLGHSVFTTLNKDWMLYLKDLWKQTYFLIRENEESFFRANVLPNYGLLYLLCKYRAQELRQLEALIPGQFGSLEKEVNKNLAVLAQFASKHNRYYSRHMHWLLKQVCDFEQLFPNLLKSLSDLGSCTQGAFLELLLQMAKVGQARARRPSKYSCSSQFSETYLGQLRSQLIDKMNHD